MENLANWLYELQDKRRKAMGSIVVCPKQALGVVVVRWA
jgi:hypothetical protein